MIIWTRRIIVTLAMTTSAPIGAETVMRARESRVVAMCAQIYAETPIGPAYREAVEATAGDPESASERIAAMAYHYKKIDLAGQRIWDAYCGELTNSLWDYGFFERI